MTREKFTIRFHGLSLEKRKELTAMSEFSAGANSDVFQERNDAQAALAAKDAEIARLTDELEALRADAARLDWLEKRGSVEINRLKRSTAINKPSRHKVTLWNDYSCDGATLRDAINATMAQDAQEGGAA